MPEKAVKLKVVDTVGHWIDQHGPQQVATSYSLFLARWAVSGAAGGVVTTLVGELSACMHMCRCIVSLRQRVTNAVWTVCVNRLTPEYFLFN